MIGTPPTQTTGAARRGGDGLDVGVMVRVPVVGVIVIGQQAVQVQQQRALAGPVRADQADALAFRHREAHPAQRRAAVAVAVVQVADLDRGAHRQPRAHIAP